MKGFNQLKNRDTLKWIALAALCLLTRSAYLIWKRETLMRPGFEYEVIADRYLETGRFLYAHPGGDLPTAWVPPGVIFVLILFKQWLPAHYHLALAVLHLLLALGSLWLILKISEHFLSPSRAFWVGLLYSLDFNLWIPMAWANETIYTVFFVLLYVYFALRLLKEPTRILAVGLGLSLGVGALFRSTLLAHVVLALLWLGFTYWKEKRLKEFYATAFFIVLAWMTPLAPWSIRNYRLFHRFIPVSQNMGNNLWQGWNPHAEGSEYGLWRGPMIEEAALEQQVKNARTEAEIDKLLTRAAIGYAKENPLRWLRQRLLSFLFFWHEHNFWAAESPYHTPLWLAVGAANLVFLLFFILGAFYAVRQEGPIRWIAAILLLHSAIHTCFHADIGSRFRYQVEPLMLLVMVYGFANRFQNRPADVR